MTTTATSLRADLSLRAIKRDLNALIGKVQDAAVVDRKNAFGLSVLHDSLVFIRDTDLRHIPAEPMEREEMLDRILNDRPGEAA